MNSKNYNLDNVQDGVIGIQQGGESGKISDHLDAEKLIEEEEKVLREVGRVVEIGTFDPKSIYQKDVPREKMNTFLFNLWVHGSFSYDNSQKFLKYLLDHTEEFHDIDNIIHTGIPLGLDKLIIDTITSKKSIVEIMTLIERVFRLNDDQKKKLVFNLYLPRLGHGYYYYYYYYNNNHFDKEDIIQILKRDLPLDGSQTIDLAKECVKTNLEIWERRFNKKDNYRGDYHVSDPIDFNLLFEQLELSPSVIFEDQEIVTVGISLLRSMLLSGPKLEIKTLEELHALAPMFFNGNFDSEIEIVAKSYLSSHYTVELADKIFKLFNCKADKVKSLIKEVLKELLLMDNKYQKQWVSYYPEELISYIEKLDLRELFYDSEVIDAALIGRKKSLEYLNKGVFTKICDKFGFDKNWFEDPELIERVKEGILAYYGSYREIGSYHQIYNDFGHEKIITDGKIKEKIQESVLLNNYLRWKDKLKIFSMWHISTDLLMAQAKEFVLSKLDQTGQTDGFNDHEFEDVFGAFPEILDLPDIKSFATARIINWTHENKYNSYYNLESKIGQIKLAIKFLKLPEDLLDQWKIKIATQLLANVEDLNQLRSFEVAQKYLKISPDVLKNIAIDSYLICLSKGQISRCILLKQGFSINLSGVDIEKLQKAGKSGLAIAFENGDLDDIIKIQEICNFSLEFFEDPSMREKICLLLSDDYLKHHNNQDFIEKLDFFGIPVNSPLLNDTYTIANIFLNIQIDEFGVQVDVDNFTESDFARLFNMARQKIPEWQDEQTIVRPFQAGVEIFGYKRMFEYTRRKYLSFHDAIHAFHDILELFKVSGLSESEFYGQVLQQVRMDDRGYEEGTAHHHLNAIAQTANKNVAEVIDRVKEYKEIEKLQELAATFNTPQAVFASWINLKRYSELEQLLGQTEVFDELRELKAEGKVELYRYVETLAFHPDSKVNMSAVIQFWRDPESFLAAEASHTPHEVHDRKKPSNYLNMPNLDLTAPELRDALVEGRVDGLSVFTPLEIRYTIPLEDVKSEPLLDLVNKALGSNKKGVDGAARNPRKLFNELGKLLKLHGLSVVEYIQGKPLPEGINLSQDIKALLYNRDFGMERPLVKTREFVARINQKSDPEGAIAGDDTVNCMPFGDGKNTVYTFNPNTAQFVIRVVKGDGKERTIAQSVLTKDADIKTLVPDVISKLQEGGGHLDDILPVDILTAAPVYVACDNVEVTPNYSDKRHQQIIEAIFRDFFREYLNRYAKTEGLNSKKVPIGQGYTDALSHLPTEKNTFAPQAPVSYSDKTGEDVYMLDLESDVKMDLIWQRQVRETKVKRRKEPPLPKVKGLGYLTFEDTLKVAYLEGVAYSDNQSLMQFLFDMENGLIAKDINNVAKERPNMSIEYTDESGRMCGYMLAWEGRLLDKGVEYSAEEFFDQPCIYVADLATDRGNRMAGGCLIQGFTELYKRNYLDKGKNIPIFAQARETTSYRIIKKQLDRLGRDAGFNFELIELETYKVGEDIMHPIIIRPILKNK